MQLLCKCFERIGVIATGEIGKPIAFIAYRPEDDTWMVLVLGDLCPASSFCIFIPLFWTETAAAPGIFGPYKNSKLITRTVNLGGLGIVGKTNEISTHFFNHPDIFSLETIRKGISITREFFMTMSSRS